MRAAQLVAASRQLHDPSIHAGILAGDLHAISAADHALPAASELKDAYLAAGGREDCEEGYTWGHQVFAAVREKLGYGRWDKILWCGGVEVRAPQRIGVGVRVEEGKRGTMKSFGALDWVTDHYGLMADVVVLP